MELFYYFGNLRKQMGDMGNNANDFDPMSKILNVYQLVDIYFITRTMIPRLNKNYYKLCLIPLNPTTQLTIEWKY